MLGQILICATLHDVNNQIKKELSESDVRSLRSEIKSDEQNSRNRSENKEIRKKFSKRYVMSR